jgi:GNAT superfamily N-acetyltransferase
MLRAKIRPARRKDLRQLLVLMRGLAAFEKYLDAFAVTERELARRAFGRSRQCRITVAEDPASKAILGYAVTVETPFTYDLKPTWTLKELFVRKDSRSGGVGEALLRAVAAQAVAAGAGRLKWDVLSGNRRAEKFYRSLGARRVTKWIPWGMDARQLAVLRRAAPGSSRSQQLRRREK